MMRLLIFSLTLCRAVLGQDSGGGTLSFEEPKNCNQKVIETWSWATLGCIKCQWTQPEFDNCEFLKHEVCQKLE
jgi:hypothetical protein